ncbi:ATP-binding protein [Burkholderia vietnamiensis]|uniref:ATP-binding protein n=1 Tax=Burkholderia vietnamiensis TaxID=60552 RepID=UPI00158D06FC|nr:ATP-binding protein [Burkholderia vietnamiensis]
MTSKVRVAVNQENFVKNLKFAFSNFSTFLAELIQNSRRAGATKVELTLEGKTLTVVDDGHGIADFQNLFTIAESGWDNQTRSLESPFGMGFTSALFACGQIRVESCGQLLDAHTRALLDMHDLTVVPGTVTIGTKLTLSNLTFDETRIKSALEAIALGYEIPVIFNGEELPRPEAIDSAEFLPTPIGSVLVRDLAGVRSNSSIVVYLQGIQVSGPAHYGRSAAAIVHLDSTRFQAKLPDRNCLIDQADKDVEIRKQVESLIHSMLVEKQRELDAEAFVNAYWDAAVSVAPDLVRDHPVVPAKVLLKLVEALCFAEWHEIYEYRYSSREPKSFSRDAFDRGEFRVVRGSGFVDLEDDADSAVQRVYAMQQGALVVVGQLPKGHWLLNAPQFDELQVTYDIVNEGAIAGSDYEAHDFDIQICDSIAIRGIWGETIVDNMEISVASSDGNGTVEKVTVFTPLNVGSMGVGVQQFQAFSSDDREDQDYRKECMARYRRWIKQARNVNPKDLLNDLLADLFVDTETVRNTRFILEVSGTGRLSVVEKVEAVAV